MRLTRKFDLNEQEKIQQAVDYTDMLLTLRICILMGGRKPAKDLRHCATMMFKRVRSDNVKLILATIIRHSLPIKRFYEIEKQAVGNAGLKEFYRMGIEASMY